MSKLTEQKLYSDLQKLTPGKWYNIEKHPEYDLMVKLLKRLIDKGEQYEFSDDYRRVKRLLWGSPCMSMPWNEMPGYKAVEHSCPPDKYGKQVKYREIFINDKLVAIESI